MQLARQQAVAHLSCTSEMAPLALSCRVAVSWCTVVLVLVSAGCEKASRMDENRPLDCALVSSAASAVLSCARPR